MRTIAAEEHFVSPAFLAGPGASSGRPHDPHVNAKPIVALSRPTARQARFPQ
jgi:hypothetical protein